MNRANTTFAEDSIAATADGVCASDARKSSLSDLALFGGTPAFAETLHVGAPNIGDRDVLMQRINELLNRRWLTNNGPLVQEFEDRVASYLGVKHCVAMCNGTVALEIAARALGLSGEVIIPSFTFVATAHCLQWQEITPVFCDIDPVTHTIDPNQVERFITPKTTAILGVHLWGNPCAVDALQEIAHRHKLKLLFDASHAFGCSGNGKMIGGFGDAETFSFHATKVLNTFEGGAVTTNSDELAEKMRLMRNFGFAGLDNVIYIGVNGKMNEVSAAMGLTSLESLDAFVEVNRRNYEAYRVGLEGIPGINLMAYPGQTACNYHYVVAEVDEAEASISRDHLLEVLTAENVRARRYFYPGAHRMEPYRSYYPNAGTLLPETERVASRVLILPTGTSVNETHIETICEVIRCAASQVSDHGPVMVSANEDK